MQLERAGVSPPLHKVLSEVNKKKNAQGLPTQEVVNPATEEAIVSISIY